jgi:hypothetical protein
MMIVQTMMSCVYLNMIFKLIALDACICWQVMMLFKFLDLFKVSHLKILCTLLLQGSLHREIPDAPPPATPPPPESPN